MKGIEAGLDVRFQPEADTNILMLSSGFPSCVKNEGEQSWLCRCEQTEEERRSAVLKFWWHHPEYPLGP